MRPPGRTVWNRPENSQNRRSNRHVLTKLDGTAKGGVIVAIARELNLPIRYVGIGEKLDDLLPF